MMKSFHVSFALVARLYVVAGTMIHTGNYELTTGANEVLPFTNITGVLTISNDYKGNVGQHLPFLEEAKQIDIRQNTFLTELSLPHLKKLQNLHVQHNTKIQVLKVPLLRQVGRLAITANLELDNVTLPALERINFFCLFCNKKLPDLNVDAVQYIDCCIVTRNEKLKILNLPALQEIGTELKIELNENLQNVNVWALKRIRRQLQISGNSRLECIQWFSLASISSIKRIALPANCVVAVSANCAVAYARAEHLPEVLKNRMNHFVEIYQQVCDFSALAVVVGSVGDHLLHSMKIKVQKIRSHTSCNPLLRLDVSVLRNIGLFLNPVRRRHIGNMECEEDNAIKTALAMQQYNFELLKDDAFHGT